MNNVSGRTIVGIGVVAGVISAALPSIPTIYLLWNGHYPGMSEEGQVGVKKVLIWSGVVAIVIIIGVLIMFNGKKK